MPKIPKTEPQTITAIYEHYEASRKDRRSSGLAVGGLGEECNRKLWYTFRWAAPIETKDGRMLRLFETGDREEARILDNLRAIGCTVTGEQERVEGCNGHLRGMIDGEVLGLPEAPQTVHIVECKTHSDKNFKTLNLGVRKAKHTHYVQMQMYMHLRGATRALYIAHNKNTDELYAERVEYDALFCAQQIARAERVITSYSAPAKLHDDPSSRAAWACGYCPAKPICHEDKFGEVNCRTCMHSRPIDGGKWHCVRHSRELSYADQLLGCPNHLYLPDLVPGEVVDVDEAAETVSYVLRNGQAFNDGQAENKGADNDTA